MSYSDNLEKLKTLCGKERLGAFLDYHRKNPEIYQTFKELATKLLQSGRKHYGAKCIFEKIRFDYDLAHPNEEFKVDNNLISLYARALAIYHPAFSTFFEFRGLKPRQDDTTDQNKLAA